MNDERENLHNKIANLEKENAKLQQEKEKLLESKDYALLTRMLIERVSVEDSLNNIIYTTLETMATSLGFFYCAYLIEKKNTWTIYDDYCTLSDATSKGQKLPVPENCIDDLEHYFDLRSDGVDLHLLIPEEHRNLALNGYLFTTVFNGDHHNLIFLANDNDSDSRFSNLVYPLSGVIETMDIFLSNAILKDELETLVRERTHDLNVALQQLEKLAITDQLTGLYNRHEYAKILQLEWEKTITSIRPLSLIILDIDHFKKYNDHYGHFAGDQCLKAIAHTMKCICEHRTTLIARFGGEEFVIILPNTDSSTGRKLAEIIRKQISNLNIEHIHSPFGHVTISAGIADTTNRDFDSSDALFIEADKALYLAKTNGRNRIEICE
jgi:diguanylate cyclase (GGDEF)-like protein